MTDEKSTLAELLTVSVDNFNRFVKAKGIDRKCDECGENIWILPVRDGFEDGDLTAPVQLAANPGTRE